MENNKQKEGFATAIGVFFATLSSAIGLGNIWKFPYLTGANGGAAFIIIYLLFVLVLGIPLMLAEFYIGRGTNKNTYGAFGEIAEEKYTNFKLNLLNKIRKSGFFKLVGFLGVATAVVIMFYYSAVAGWVYSYVPKAISGDFSSVSGMSNEAALKFTSDKFTESISGVYSPIFWQAVVIIVVSVVLIAGIKKGIEKATKFLMPLFLVLILVCDIRSLSLSKAGEGLSFLFHPDFSKITPLVLVTAMGLAFFKLAIAMGILISYSGYFKKDTDLVKNAVTVAVADTIISLLAGVAIFPVVFEFGLDPSAGVGLLFQSIPLAFAQLPFGNTLLAIFFLLTAIAATMALISLAEVPVRVIMEQFNIKRSKAVIMSSVTIFVVGALTVHPKSVFGAVLIGSRNLFDFFGFLTESISMPLVAFLTAIFIGYFISKESFESELTNNGELKKNTKYVGLLRFLLRYLIPILVLIIFLNAMGIIGK